MLVVAGLCDHHNVAGNISPVQVSYLPFNRGNSEAWMMYSDDDGQSWAEAHMLQPSLVPSSWTWLGFGPPGGIELKDPKSPASGRLLVPSYRSNSLLYDNGILFSSVYIMYSDDGGESWQNSEFISNGPFSLNAVMGNEVQAAELSGGDIVINARPLSGNRLQATSKDGGLTFTPFQRVANLPGPKFVGCEGSIATSRNGKVLWYSGPNSQPDDGAFRRNMSVWKASAENPYDYEFIKRIRPGPCGYSSIAELKDGRVVILYEWSKESSLLFLPHVITLTVIDNGTGIINRTCHHDTSNKSATINSKAWQQAQTLTVTNFYSSWRYATVITFVVIAFFIALVTAFTRKEKGLRLLCCYCYLAIPHESFDDKYELYANGIYYIAELMILLVGLMTFCAGILGLGLMVQFKGDDPVRYTKQALNTIIFFVSASIASVLSSRTAGCIRAMFNITMGKFEKILPVFDC